MIEYATISEIGNKETNEDSVRVFINQPLLTYGFVLADGLGGHGNGDVASKTVTDCVGAVIENTDSFDGFFLDECFNTAQEFLMDEKDRLGLYSIKTTLVSLIISDDTAQWGHIGDSRLYHFRNNKMISRTSDHSVPEMLYISGQIKESEIRHHPNRSNLLAAMGTEWERPAYEIDERGIQIQKGDTFLLCSDGFWEWIDEKNMIKHIKRGKKPYEVLKNMVEDVKLNAGDNEMDNYSAVLIKIN